VVAAIVVGSSLVIGVADVPIPGVDLGCCDAWLYRRGFDRVLRGLRCFQAQKDAKAAEVNFQG
jgi:hypothetical protein